jgi:nucleoside-diphosphate-sugar epimerase
MNTVIVTGAAGYLGSHICEHYLTAGYKVIGLDNFSTGLKSNIEHLKAFSKNFLFFDYDVCQTWDFLKSTTSNLKYVFHFASPASPPLYQKLNLETLWVNSLGLKHALDFADLYKAKVVFASTSEVYGDPDVSPQPESYWGNVNSFGERSCYDEGKRFGESLIFSHNKRHGTRHGLIRFFNSYGPRMNPDDGRVIINFITQALAGKPLTVYGDGTQTRSFCYIDDTLAGIVSYAEKDLTFPVNIGNDKEFTINDLVEVVKTVTKTHSQTVYEPLPADDPRKRRPDLSIAFRELSPWKPHTNLEAGIRKMAEWVKTL